MPNFENQIMENRSYQKSNKIVLSKFQCSLAENQLLSIAVTRIQETNDPQNPLEVCLYPSELKQIISDGAHIYRDLKIISKAIISHTMFLEDGKGNFKAFSIVPNAEYVNGVLRLKFNSELKQHLLALDKNYTTFELSVMTSFKRSSSFRIYELLKKDLYHSRAKINGGRVDVEYNLFEFRFLIGIANSDSEHMKNRIKTMTTVDWEELYNVLEKYGSKQDIKYKDTDKLQKDCLNVAQVELKEKSDISFEYELIRIGKSYKRIRFHIYPNVPVNEHEIKERQKCVEKISSANRQLEVPMDMNPEAQALYDKYVGHNTLAKKEIDLLLKTADMKPEDVDSAIAYTDKQVHVTNYMGYIVNAIKNRYFESEPIEVVTGMKELADFNHRAQSEEVKAETWEYLKTKKDFPDFLEFEYRSTGYSLDELEELMPRSAAVAEYMKWIKQAKNK